MPEYTFVIAVLNTTTQESDIIIAKGMAELDLVISRLPRHITLMSMQNIGSTVPATEFLQNLTDDGDMHFGSH